MFVDTKKQRGFTLIELMVVLGIVAILAAIVAPRWELYRSRMVVGEATNTVCSAFRDARSESLLEQCEMSFNVDNTNKKIEIMRRSNGSDAQWYKTYHFSPEVFVGGTADISLVIGRGGSVASATGVTSSTSSVGKVSVKVYDISVTSLATQAVDHVFITADGRASIGASL